jgi:hypothetical protein
MQIVERLRLAFVPYSSLGGGHQTMAGIIDQDAEHKGFELLPEA